MSELRQKFEELPDIKGIIYGSDFGFNESLNQYYHPDHTNHRLNYAFIMGAWCAFQSRQAEIDQLKAELALCREENKGLVSRVNEQHSINTALNSETIKQREQIQHYMGKCVERNKQVDEGLKLIKSLYKSEFSQRSSPSIHVSQIREIEKALRGEHEN